MSKEDINKKEIGARIKRLRKEAGLRQWQLAEMIGATQPAIHMYERGVLPEPRRLLELARIGNTTVEWILTGRHWENGSEEMQRVPEDVYHLAFQFKEYSPEDRDVLESALHTLNQVVEALTAKQDTAGASIEELARRIRESAVGSLAALTAAVQVHATAQRALLAETTARYRRFSQEASAPASAEAAESASGRRRRPIRMRPASLEPLRGHIFRADGSFLLLQDLLGDKELRGELEETLSRLNAKLEAKRSRVTKMKKAQRGK